MRAAAALMLLLSLPALAKGQQCRETAGIYGEKPTPAQHASMRRLVHEVARVEGVDPAALEAIAMVETGLRPAVGLDCELGPFQVMQFWAGIFQLASPSLLWDLRINATAAARVYKAAFARWRPAFAALARNPALRKAGFRGRALDRATFAAMAYHWGRAPKALEGHDAAHAALPASAARYAVNFKRELAAARARRARG